jgi:hypothetical protein
MKGQTKIYFQHKIFPVSKPQKTTTVYQHILIIFQKTRLK